MSTATPPAAPKAPTAPATPPAEAEKRPDRIDFPLAEGQLLKTWPESHDPAKHRQIPRKAFECESVWYLHEQAKALAKAKLMGERAEEAKRFGNTKDRVRAKKLIQLRKKTAELEAALKDQGVNVDDLLKGLDLG